MLPPKKPKKLTLDEIQSISEKKQYKGLTQEQIALKQENIEKNQQN